MRTLPASPLDGFRYDPELVTTTEERELVAALLAWPSSPVRMRGQVARRRTMHFGWIYGYESSRITPGPPIPAVLQPLRERAASLSGVAPAELVEVLVNEYPAGAGIGWHRDAPQFGVVVGVSLLSGCRLRFRRGAGAAGETRAVQLEPRSGYVLDGEARWRWQHSVPPVKAPRYSITFRSLR